MKLSGKRKYRDQAIAVCSLLVFSPVVGWSAPGDLDTSFDIDGIVIIDVAGINSPDDARAVALQPDGKILVAGTTNNSFSLLRLNSDGSRDTGFGSNGTVITRLNIGGDFAYALTVQADGKILIGGTSITNQNEFALLRVNGDGTLDNGFDGDGKVTTPIGAVGGIAYGMALQPDNKIVLVGAANNGTNLDFGVVRYNSDGSLDKTFDGDGKLTTPVTTAAHDTAQAVAIQPDGKIVVVGSTNNGDFGLVRYNGNGSLDTGFGGNGIVVTSITADEYARAIALQPDGKILVAGQAVHPISGQRGFAVARYDTAGNLDTTFSGDGIIVTEPEIPGAIDEAFALAVQPDGRILVAGSSTFGPADVALARYTDDGSLDNSFAGDGMVRVDIAFGSADFGHGLAVQPDGKLLLGAWQATAGDFALIRFEGFNLDVTPAAYIFTDETDVAQSQVQTSNLVTVSDLTNGVSVPVSVSEGEYALNGSMTYTSAINWVKNGDQINVRHTSAASENTVANTLLSLGGVMAPNGITHLGTVETVKDTYSTTTEATSDGGEGCFIATAAYGSYLEPEVVVLRRFRDRFLLTNALGRAFVEFYYEYSPPLANYIAAAELRRWVARIALTPVLYSIKYPGTALGLFLIAALVIPRFRRNSLGQYFLKS